jgi:hypothetical protein
MTRTKFYMKDWEVVAGNDAQQCEEQVRQVYLIRYQSLKSPLCCCVLITLPTASLNADHSIM